VSVFIDRFTQEIPEMTKSTLIEGIHFSRGVVAAHCCELAELDSQIVGLAWKEALVHMPGINVLVAASPEDYYAKFVQLLETMKDALVIPCTLRGNVIANRFRDRHRVLAEPSLNALEDFDKLKLKLQQHRLRHFFLPHFLCSDEEILYPVLAKPLYGHSSQGQLVITCDADLAKLCEPSSYYYEPLLPEGFEEYSMTVVAVPNARSWRCIKRLGLTNGRTTRAGRSINPEVQKAADTIARNLYCQTIFNLQFAWSQERAIIFDLNPRFGYSELYRACFGFNFVSVFLGKQSRLSTDSNALSEHEALSLRQAHYDRTRRS
jgi:hypothetical protein